MDMIKKYIGALYLTARFYLVTGLCIILFITSFLLPQIYLVTKLLLFVFIMLVIIDYLFLFIIGKTPKAKRITAGRFSNGDDNKVERDL